MKNADGKLCELAVFNEFTEMGQSLILGIGNELNKIKHALNHSALEFETTLVSEDAAEEGEHTGLLAGELEAQGADSLHNGDLELVCDFRHEGRYLLHQSINTSLVASLKQCRNSKGGDGSVGVRNEEFNIGVAGSDCCRLEGRKAVEDAESCKLGNGSRRGEEHLQDMNGLVDFGIGDISHVANSLSGFEVNHFALVSQPAVEELHHGLAQTSILLGELCGQTDEHDQRGGALDSTRGAKLLNHLDESHAIVRAHLVEETNGVILSHVGAVDRESAAGRESKREATTRLARGRSLLSLALPATNNILGDWQQVVR